MENITTTHILVGIIILLVAICFVLGAFLYLRKLFTSLEHKETDSNLSPEVHNDEDNLDEPVFPEDRVEKDWYGKYLDEHQKSKEKPKKSRGPWFKYITEEDTDGREWEKTKILFKVCLAIFIFSIISAISLWVLNDKYSEYAVPMRGTITERHPSGMAMFDSEYFTGPVKLSFQASKTARVGDEIGLMIKYSNLRETGAKYDLNNPDIQRMLKTESGWFPMLGLILGLSIFLSFLVGMNQLYALYISDNNGKFKKSYEEQLEKYREERAKQKARNARKQGLPVSKNPPPPKRKPQHIDPMPSQELLKLTMGEIRAKAEELNDAFEELEVIQDMGINVDGREGPVLERYYRKEKNKITREMMVFARTNPIYYFDPIENRLRND